MRADGNALLLTAAQTAEVNRAIAAHGGVHDLVGAPLQLTGAEVRTRIHAAAQDLVGELPLLYDGEERLSAEGWDAAHENCAAAAVPEYVIPGYAVAVERTTARVTVCFSSSRRVTMTDG